MPLDSVPLKSPSESVLRQKERKKKGVGGGGGIEIGADNNSDEILEVPAEVEQDRERLIVRPQALSTSPRGDSRHESKQESAHICKRKGIKTSKTPPSQIRLGPRLHPGIRA